MTDMKFPDMPAGTTNSSSVYQALREQIVTLHRAPGEKLSDKLLSQEFATSRTPVREAILRLAEEQMVYIVPNSGTFVSRIQPSLLRNAHFVRRALECASLRDAAPLSVTAQRRLRRLYAEQERASGSADPGPFYKADDAFHRFLMESTDHAEAWQIVDRVKAQIDRVRYIAISDAGRKTMVLEQHRRILEAVERADPAAAALAMRDHLDDSIASLTRTVGVLKSYVD